MPPYEPEEDGLLHHQRQPTKGACLLYKGVYSVNGFLMLTGVWHTVAVGPFATGGSCDVRDHRKRWFPATSEVSPSIGNGWLTMLCIQEKKRQKHFINLIPSENFTSQAVLDALGSPMQSLSSPVEAGRGTPRSPPCRNVTDERR